MVSHEEWQREIVELGKQLERWIRNFSVFEPSKYLEAEKFPEAGEVALEFRLGANTRFMLEPAEFAEDQLPTTAFLYAYPTMRRIRLVGPDSQGKWEIQSADGIPMGYQWTGGQFYQILTYLTHESLPKAV